VPQAKNTQSAGRLSAAAAHARRRSVANGVGSAAAPAALLRPAGAAQRPQGAKRPTGAKPPLASASPAEQGEANDQGEDEEEQDDDLGGTASGGGSDGLSALLRHLELEQFEAALRRNGVQSLAQVASVADSLFTSPAVGMKTVHVRKLRDGSRARLLGVHLSRIQGTGDGSPGSPGQLDDESPEADKKAMDQQLADKRAELDAALAAKAAARKAKPAELAAVAALPQAPLLAAAGRVQESGRGTLL
jgi:hypothetical protein